MFIGFVNSVGITPIDSYEILDIKNIMMGYESRNIFILLILGNIMLGNIKDIR